MRPSWVTDTETRFVRVFLWEMPMAVMPELQRYPNLASHVFGVPLMIHPAKADMIIAGLGPRLLGVGELHSTSLQSTGERPDPQAYTTLFGEARRPGYRVIDSVAVVDVFGVLAHRGGIDGMSSYVLGYDSIARRLETAVADPDVRSIVLNMDTPGGEAAAVFDLTDQVREVSKRKPVHAVIGDMAASAGYAIASAADSISITRTGMAGSIGVVMRHVDASRQMKKAGLAIEHIYAGAHKVDGHPFAPLTAEVRADLQAEVDKVYDLFVETVAENRVMDPADVRATEARMYTGGEAVKVGLADRIETPDEMIARLNGRSELPDEETSMSKEQDKPLAAKAEQEQPSVGDLAARYDQGYRDGATAERERITAIIDCEAAKDRSAQARTIALTTDMKVDDAARLLAASPKETTVSPLSPLASAMHANGTPGVGDGGGEQEPDQAQAILADFQGATGVTLSTKHSH